MANLQIIRSLLHERKISIRDFSKMIGITEQGLQKIMRENTTKVDTLETIADKLDVPIDIFFDKNKRSVIDKESAETSVSVVELFKTIQIQAETIRSQQRIIDAFSTAQKESKSA